MEQLRCDYSSPDRCTRCGGWIEFTEDHDGAYYRCLSCGRHTYPAPDVGSPVAKACIRQLPPNNHQLTGYDDGWAIDQTVWRERTGYPQGKSPESGTPNVRNQGLTSPVLGTGNPRSSSCHKKPNEEPNVTGDSDNTGKAVFEHVEAAETALDFDPDKGSGRSVFSEEEGVTGAAIDGCEEHDQEPERIPSKAENPLSPQPLFPRNSLSRT